MGIDRSLGAWATRGHVSADQSSFHRILEGASDDEVHLQDRLWRQWARPVGWVQHPVVERLEVVGAEPSNVHMTDRGEDVPVDLPPIPIPSGSGQIDLLPGQPLAGQVGAVGE